jgi:hypothetical protein
MRARSTRHLLVLGGCSAVMLAAILAGRAAAGKGTKNLQVLPARMSEKEVKKVMKGWTQALGVECGFCHVAGDFAKDTEHKEEARAMLRMTNELNKTYMAKYGLTIGCDMCHRGHEHPPTLKRPASGEH